MDFSEHTASKTLKHCADRADILQSLMAAMSVWRFGREGQSKRAWQCMLAATYQAALPGPATAAEPPQHALVRKLLDITINTRRHKARVLCSFEGSTSHRWG